ncbi:MAG: response regulator [Candidatus Neomarinimicrobiota bacterium]
MPTDQIHPDQAQTALLFETDRAVVKTLTLQFQDRNWEVISADDPEQALNLLREHNPVVALLDMISPEVEGIELAGRMREISADLIIILLTGYPEPDLAKADIHHLVYTYLVKPVRIDQLSLVIARAQRELAVVRENLELKRQVATLQSELQATMQLAESGQEPGPTQEDESLSRHMPSGRGEGALTGPRPTAIASYERQKYTADLGRHPVSPTPIKPEPAPEQETPKQETPEKESSGEQTEESES